MTKRQWTSIHWLALATFLVLFVLGAALLGFSFLVDPAPSPTPTRTPRPSPTATSTNTPTPTQTPTPTITPTATPLPESVQLSVVGFPQQRSLSCESRSAVDLAGYWGITVEEESFFDALPSSGNPHLGFVGDVDGPVGKLPPEGYGVYAEPVASVLRDVGLAAEATYRLGLEGLRAELAAGRPVIIWATYSLELHPTTEYTSPDGQTSIVVPYMHTFIAVGYDPDGVYLLDAYDADTEYHDNATLLAAWGQLGQMAVTVAGPPE